MRAQRQCNDLARFLFFCLVLCAYELRLVTFCYIGPIIASVVVVWLFLQSFTLSPTSRNSRSTQDQSFMRERNGMSGEY